MQELPGQYLFKKFLKNFLRLSGSSRAYLERAETIDCQAFHERNGLLLLDKTLNDSRVIRFSA